MRAHNCAVSEEPLVPHPVYGPRGEEKLGVQAHMRPTPVCPPHYGSHAKTEKPPVAAPQNARLTQASEPSSLEG